jgi:hypothetical protein
MKVALKAVNGLYVAAEDGGGIDTRASGRVALRANRAEIGSWETFELTRYGDIEITLQTCDGYYITAEGGGGSYLRTNELSPGVWETFRCCGTGEGLMLVTHDDLHQLGLSDDNLDPVLDAKRAWQALEVIPLEPVPEPVPPEPEPGPEPPEPIVPPGPDPVLDQWRGCFCIPGALPGQPEGMGDRARIWTPAYGCYVDGWRANIRAAYKQRGYSHFPYNCAGLPYGDDYPELADDASRVARDLEELEHAGLIPVVFATDDRNPWVLCTSFVANANLMKIVVPCWEMNGPLGDPDKDKEEQNQKDAITRTVTAAPQAQCYLHFTPGHGSISYRNEIEGWKWCQANGTTGLLAQGSNRFAAESPQQGGEGLESTAVRLLGLTDLGIPPAWAGVNQRTVKFEYGIWDMYHGHVKEQTLRDYTMAFLSYAPHVCGYCDGGW